MVLDPDFGDLLHEVQPDQPVWIVDSARNTPVVKALWAAPPVQRTLTDVTSFTATERDPEREFLAQLDMIDLHHGPYSTRTPYTLIEVVGTPLTDNVCAALRELGFTEFTRDHRGFTCHRREAEAHQLR